MSPETGLFFFDSSYRPVPLAQQYIGISEQNFAARNDLLNEICYKKVFVCRWTPFGSLSVNTLKINWCNGTLVPFVSDC